MSAAVSELPPPVYEAAAPPPNHDTSLTLVEMNSDGEGATPLMYACQQARDAELRSIIAQKPNAVRERDRTLKTALHYCAENATLSCVEIVLNAAPELLDAKDEDGYTTLHLAVIAGNAPLIKALLAKGADVNCLDNERHSVVHWAAVCGEVEALEIVLVAGAASSSPDIHGGYPLHYAAQMCGPTGDRDGVSRLGLAVLRTLLSHGVDVNVTDQDGRQPILWAASAGSADAILALVNAGANVEADDKDGLTALHCAASRGHTDCLETLITLCGASVDVMDSNGCTALFYAVTLGHADATQLLLEHGAQPNRQDRKGRTPAHCGAAKGQLETLRLLSSRGANMWARNVKGDYPLHEAVSSGRKDLVRWLLSQRPDAVNASNNDGRCPLHIAAINNNVEFCKIILDCESLVNPVMRTSKGQLMTPLDAALHKGNRGCAKYLQLHGGVPANKLTSQAAALRGAQHRLEPHSDQLITPDWGPNLAVPDVRGAHSLMQSPVEYTGQKNLTVVDANTRTLEVRVQENVNVHKGERRGSESSSDERARRRRRKRRTRRDDGSEPTDSDDRRRRRRRRREREDEYDSDAENRRRRRKSRRSRDSDESVDSDKEEKRSRRDKRHRHRRSSSRDRRSSSRDRKSNDERQRNDKVGRDKGDVIEDEDRPQKTSKHVEIEDDKFAEKGKESRKIITEAVETKEVVKSKRTVEHKEEETSSSKPAVTKSTKTTNKEKKVEEQVTRKSSEIVQSGLVIQKQDETLSQDDQEIATQRVVTAIVHREETADTNEPVQIHEEDEDNVEKGADQIKEFIEAERQLSVETREEDELEAEIKEEDTKELDHDRQETVKHGEEAKREEESSGREASSKEEKEEEEEIEKGEDEHDDKDFWDDGEEKSKEPETAEQEESKQEEVTEDNKLITEEDGKGTEDICKPSESDEEKHKIETTKEEESAITVDTEETKNHHDEATHSLESNEFKTAGGEEKLSDTSEHETMSVEKERTSPEPEEGEHKLDGDRKSEEHLEEEVKKSSLSSKEGEHTEEEVKEIHEREDKEEVVEAVKDSVINELHKEGSDEQKESVGSGSIEKSISVEKRDESELTGDDVGDKTISDEAEEILIKTQEEDSGKSSSRKTSEEKVHSDERRDGKEEEVADNSKGLVKVLGRTVMSDDELKGSVTVETKSEDPNRGRSRVREKQRRSKSSFEIVSPARSVGDDEPDSERTRSRNGADSSLLPDSGFEPSPRRDRTRFRRGDASRIPRACRRPAAQHPEEDINEDERVDLSTVSVTQAVQNSMRKYHLERRIFHELLELKRLQIRAGRSNEAVLVKRLADDYKRAGLIIGLKQYDGVYTFRAFERFLYDQLRILQNSDRRLIPRLKPTDDLEKLTKALRRTRAGNTLLDNVPDNPIFCTYGTHRCYHATHAYTGIPCAAYISKLNHHTIPKPGAKVSGQPGFLPKIDSSQRRTDGQNAEIARCLRYVDPSRPVTLELSHGNEKQVISLPTEKLDKNKRYYVTFTIKGGESKSDDGSSGGGEKHQHSKSF